MSDINLHVTYPVGVDALWRALADPTEFGRWGMAERGFRLKEGQEFTLESAPNRFWDGVFLCKIGAFAEGSHLRYTYRNEGLGLNGVVDWKVSGDRNNSTIKLRQTGFTGLKGSFYKMLLSAGWKQMLKKNLARELGTA